MLLYNIASIGYTRIRWSDTLKGILA